MKYGLIVVSVDDFVHIVENTKSIVKLRVIADEGFDHIVIGTTLYVPKSEFWEFIRDNVR